ncbi:hypothetical protein SODALDRAFT_374703 [Sodiomyces alkalinus F11]|uniref:Xylanolytic transcriptional activator regulatory domain-containing protein n=1 Tax=Sodiomyces alkalinus (strain CBS 110278 / VKM F-3762 / F11) TaxID=1314773 RepID=A0A3N2Q6M2_SODAK|nr:hypothetical protein SODALDRAFT_374703 [Sodiomyces alkalinus F11]ROT42356.1 hypothetical protein SODALDRAFT_374703 [Sodiomyces alkalinus F11]
MEVGEDARALGNGDAPSSTNAGENTYKNKSFAVALGLPDGSEHMPFRWIELREGDLRETLTTDLPDQIDSLLLDSEDRRARYMKKDESLLLDFEIPVLMLTFSFSPVWAPLALPALILVHPRLRVGATVVVDNIISSRARYQDLIEYLDHSANGLKRHRPPVQRRTPDTGVHRRGDRPVIIVGGVGTKRKLSNKACETCRKRHKRCSHVRRTPTASTPDAISAHASAASPPSSEAMTSTRSRTADAAHLHFVGDLSPEASFLANRGQDRGAGGHQPPRRGEIGVWVGQRPDDRVDAPSDTRRGADVATVEPNHTGPFPASRALMGLNNFDRLLDIYYAKFDTIFPVLHAEEASLEKHDAMEAAVLRQCICLIAALDPSARGHLRLGQDENGVVLLQMEFRSRVAMALKLALDADFIHDKMVQLQVCILMSFYADKPSSGEFSAQYCAQPVQLTQMMGLHLGWPGDRGTTEKSKRVFWCVWTLDRLNAAANGRPIFIHHQDMDKRVLDAVPEQIPAFQLFIRISRFLDRVISKYRPHAPPESQQLETPSFDDLVCEARAADVTASLLASLELYYHAVVILQGRPQGIASGRAPCSSAQTFCAASIISIASEEYRSSLTFWAVVPYAVSLASSVAYRNFRNSPIPYHRKRAYGLLQASCDMLDDLGKAFRSARMMARLAKDTLQEVERISVNRNRIKPREGAAAPSGRGSTEPQTEKNTVQTCSQPPVTSTSPVSPGPTTMVAIPLTQPPTLVAPVSVAQLEPGIFQGLDFSDVSGIFDEFDPEFQLDRVDALFSANLNPAVPFLPTEWIDDAQFGVQP